MFKNETKIVDRKQENADVKSVKEEKKIPKLAELLDFSGIEVFEKEFKPYGTFKLKIPTPLQKINISNRVATFLGSSIEITEDGRMIDKVTPEERNYAVAVITLEHVLISPQDFIPSQCRDSELIVMLWEWYVESLNEFTTSVKKKKESYINE